MIVIAGRRVTRATTTKVYVLMVLTASAARVTW
jgi:hypothetical protein